MEFRNLGRSGLRVTSICLGTMAFSRWIDEAMSDRILDTALDAGINFLDTADVYGRGMDVGDPAKSGESEEFIGHLLGARRQRIVLATKVNGVVGRGPNDRGLSRLHIMAAVEASLRRLRTGYLDLYQCHAFDPWVPMEETLRALDDLVRHGKVRYIGCSNFAAWQIAKALGISERMGLDRFISVQPQYSLLWRDAERELIPFCRSEGVGMMVYSPLARGVLTGKYRQGEAPPEGSRAAAGEARIKPLLTDHNHDRVEAFRSACARWEIPMAHAAMAWVLANPAVTSAIVGASRPDHVTDAVAASQVKLTAEQLEELNAMFAP